jgi:phosphatidylglycerophosphatase A
LEKKALTTSVKQRLEKGLKPGNRPGLAFLFGHPAHFFALGFGSGLSPFAPGTAGTAMAFPLYWGLMQFLGLAPMLAFIAASFLAGIWFCEVAGRNMGVSDPGPVVWDEIVATWLILAFIPVHWGWWLAAFFLFRLFDVWKPFPIRQIDERTRGGFGVMLDDLLAGLYALAVLLIFQWLIW